MATDGKFDCPEKGSIKPQLLPRVATGCRKERLEQRQPLGLVSVAIPHELRVLANAPDRHPGGAELCADDDPPDVLGHESSMSGAVALDRCEQPGSLVVADRVRAHARLASRLRDR